jgi:hypothetical protein
MTEMQWFRLGIRFEERGRKRKALHVRRKRMNHVYFRRAQKQKGGENDFAARNGTQKINHKFG